MQNWRHYWNDPKITQSADPLAQVGKTVSKVPIDERQLEQIIKSILAALSIGGQDRVLDLCCGNGLLTRAISAHCASITGVDFSMPLLEVARKTFNAENIDYVLADVSNLPTEITGASYDKIYMYEALQHLTPAQTDSMLSALSSGPLATAPIFFASVPDREKLWTFYDTPARRRDYERRVQEGTEAIGYWWDREELSSLLGSHGYKTQILPQNEILHGARYRFDALCSRT